MCFSCNLKNAQKSGILFAPKMSWSNLIFTTLFTTSADDKFTVFFSYFSPKKALTFYAICMESKSLFSGKSKKNILKCLLKFLPSIPSVKITFIPFFCHCHNKMKTSTCTFWCMSEAILW